MTSKKNALEVAEALTLKQGIDVRILDVRGIASFADFFVIATGGSDRHVRTLADVTLEASRKSGARALGTEGTTTARWILIDLGDVLVHLFQEEAREFYALERLWGDAFALDLPRAAGGSA